MQKSKVFLSFILSFTAFFLSSVWHFAKLAAKNAYIYGKKLILKFDELLCTTRNSLLFIICYSFIINFFLEAALRKSFKEAFNLLLSDPLVFIIGLLIVLATFSVMYLFKRRAFIFALISMVWIIINYVSYFLICQRTTPFNATDLRVIRSALDIIPIYLSVFDMILLGIAILFMVFLIVMIFIKCKRAKGILSISPVITVIICSLTLISVVANTKFVINADRFDNLPNKFREHGFAYCFIYSVIDNGIPKPSNYSHAVFNEQRGKVISTTPVVDKPEIQKVCSENDLTKAVLDAVINDYKELPNYSFYNISEETANGVIEHLTTEYEANPNLSSPNHEDHVTHFPQSFERPNIIFLQLESFYDVNNIEGYSYSQAPHPIYSLLKENLPGGKLTVPSIGAGTANTEFEIMTGMDVSFFGIAEYPYLSVLQKKTCESMAYNSKEYGYTSHVIHNHKGTFYDRNIVFPNLGFDTFTSIENMPLIIKNRRNWGKDTMLINPILESLDSTESQDLIYTISVQPHGRYPSGSKYESLLEGEEPRVKVSGNEDNPENPGFEYYVNELREVDTFIGNLLLELSFRDEPTILVMYGDHLPAFSVQKSWTLKEGDCYQTDYIIWNNCNIDFSDAKDLKTYQLCSYIFSKVGINDGDFNILNRLYLENDTDDYSHLRHIYQYAMLYDNSLRNSDGDISIPSYERVNTKYGITSTTILGAYTIDGRTYVQGENFNEFSKVTVNGKPVDTEFVNSTLLITDKELIVGNKIGAMQQGVNHAVLGESSNSITYSSLMIVSDELKAELLDELIPSPDDYVDTDENIHEDATAEFVTGADEQNMIQQDINKINDDNTYSTPDIVS